MTESQDQPLQITVNGQARTFAAGTTVQALLEALRIPTQAVAVERNRAVVRRAAHATTTLQDGDVIEVVRFVGGG
jgi:thiamine biosynthesis protein ThiS